MNAKEYNQCVEHYADALYRYVHRGFRHIDDAQDIVQHCFEKLWMKREQIGMPEAKAFLYVSARNASIDDWRKNHRIVSFENHTQQDSGYEPDEVFETMDFARECLHHLPEVQRSIFLLREYEGHAYEEIAEQLELTLSQVKVNLFRARKKIHEFMQEKKIVL
ncbi:MAG: RNA polymerase sigma factor [Saprospiraceae bacterium]|nr:RNA polymerase sigma factor [Saprospiraceae bacterium]MCB9322052.1 RNA polymerase sigma factor [Lewinellaceae bacterium]